MAGKQKLELTWIGKENRPRLEPRILVEDAGKSYHAAEKVTEQDIFDNRLIFGDNLLALKALEQEFTGKVKCIYIDPPYNTGAAFGQYDDSLEHSLWLTLIRNRIEILYRLLRDDGSIWISIDDNEAAYLRVVLDEVFGRLNFVSTMIWEKRTTRENRKVFSFNHDYLIVFARDRSIFESCRNSLPFGEEVKLRYKNPDGDSRGAWQSVSMNAQAGPGRRQEQFYPICLPSGRVVNPPPGRCWLYTEARFKEEIGKDNIWFGAEGDNAPRVKKFLVEDGDQGLTPETIWPASEVGTNDSAKKDLLTMFGGNTVFETPKPEALIQRVLQIATNPGDLVLDSFAGSGTTGAVAQKMGRRWIMVELGEHIHSHIIPRLTKVIDGADPGGITESTGWKGGGGFRYYKLAPSLIELDRFGMQVISKQYNSAMLAEAMCKLLGFRYAPNAEVYWQHGHSSERDFLYVTTQTLSHEQLAQLSEEVGDGRSLLVACSAFRGKAAMFGNLTVQKIPSAVLGKCEWGKDDYSLEVENLPRARVAESVGQLGLFGSKL